MLLAPYLSIEIPKGIDVSPYDKKNANGSKAAIVSETLYSTWNLSIITPITDVSKPNDIYNKTVT